MINIDIPPEPLLAQPYALLAQAQNNSPAPPFDYIARFCRETEPVREYGPNAVHLLAPPLAMRNYFAGLGAKVNPGDIRSSLLDLPKKGKIVVYDGNNGYPIYEYLPNTGFLGDDQVVFKLEYAGKIYKAIYKLRVVDYVDIHGSSCPEDRVIKVPKSLKKSSETGSGGSGLPEVFFPSVQFSVLGEGVLGQADAQMITLDTDATGYGGFIDDTPDLNDEFLPTSNPNEWVARPGSAAEGTMALMELAGAFVTPDSRSAPYAPFAPMGLPLLFTRVSRSRNDTVTAALATGQALLTANHHTRRDASINLQERTAYGPGNQCAIKYADHKMRI